MRKCYHINDKEFKDPFLFHQWVVSSEDTMFAIVENIHTGECKTLGMDRIKFNKEKEELK